MPFDTLTYYKYDLTNLQLLHTSSDSYDALCLLGVHLVDSSLFVWRWNWLQWRRGLLDHWSSSSWTPSRKGAFLDKYQTQLFEFILYNLDSTTLHSSPLTALLRQDLHRYARTWFWWSESHSVVWSWISMPAVSWPKYISTCLSWRTRISPLTMAIFSNLTARCSRLQQNTFFFKEKQGGVLDECLKGIKRPGQMKLINFLLFFDWRTKTSWFQIFRYSSLQGAAIGSSTRDCLWALTWLGWSTLACKCLKKNKEGWWLFFLLCWGWITFSTSRLTQTLR